MEHKDYYDLLDVEKTSDTDTIKNAYRKLARKYHPDVNPDDPDAQSRYHEINEAHQVLTDPDARAKYDRLDASQKAFQANNSGNDFDWTPWVTGVDVKPGSKVNIDEVIKEIEERGTGGFSSFFEAIFGGMGVSKTAPNKGPDYNQQVEISLEEAFAGTSRILRVGGKRLEVRIPRGAQNGTKVRVRNEGGPGTGGGPRGDLYLEILVTPHPSFERSGDDLQLDLPVNVYTAVLGGEVIVPILKGKIKLRIPPETQSGRVFRLRNQGMPSLRNPDQRGDLYAKVMITVPENLTEEEIELFEELADIRGL